MKEQSSPQFIWFELGSLLTILALAMFWVATPSSLAQQDNRQLKREQNQQTSQRRVALVIGNGAYKTVAPLRNPTNDATLLAATLRKLGFEVTVATDKSQREMKQLIRQFGQSLRGGGGVGLFYFAGHGVQARGHNYLIPVDADIQTEADLEDVAVDVNYVLHMMDDAQNALNIAILDACRNNPFARSFRSVNEGLAQVKAPTGTLIAYATSPDSVAADGGGVNSPYAEELTKQMETPGVVLETMFRRVTEQVSSRTGGRQEPWVSDNHKGEFYFSKSSVNSDPMAVEREYWETIRNSVEAQDYKDYLQTYPKGTYSAIARAKIKQLETAKNTTPSKQPPNVAGKTAGGSIDPAKGSLARPKSFKNQQGIEMVYVPPDGFSMGSENSHENERPVHRVTISEGFYMGRYEVTQSQWQAVIGKNPSEFKTCGGNCPVENVSWNDVQEFVNKLNETNDGYKYRLPTEAEWEYACRAGSTGDYYEADVADIAWYTDNSGKRTRPVGEKQPNAFGLYDMAGNVWEWCRDWYHDNYNGAPTDGTAWVSGGNLKYRVLRGGSWDSPAANVRSAFRGVNSPDGRTLYYGFRLVADVRTGVSQSLDNEQSSSAVNNVSEPDNIAKTNGSSPKNFKNQQGIEMVYIPSGSFAMGSELSGNEMPVHRVAIANGFYIGKYEVTQAQWQAVMGNNPSEFKECGSVCPVENVSWDDAQEFINKLNGVNDDFSYRLPSEAEWEYACRAGTTGNFTAEKMSDVAWYDDNSKARPHVVGGKRPNAFGLHDMSGNVREWCQDLYHQNYIGAPSDGTAWISGGDGKSRVLRGGSWFDMLSFLRPSHRDVVLPDFRNSNYGFRLVAVGRNK